MRKEERYKGVLNWFNEHVPVAETELHYDNPYQLLIAVILSAQCTDKRVNMTKRSFLNGWKHSVEDFSLSSSSVPVCRMDRRLVLWHFLLEGTGECQVMPAWQYG